MNSPEYAGHQQSRSAHLTLPAVRYAIVIALMACCGTSFAQQPPATNSPLEISGSAPWTPDLVAAIDDYVIDPGFNGGHLLLDHFADASNLDQQGLVTANLYSNGDMVVAGLVPDGVGGGFCGDGTKLCSIGLVRYNAAGQRIPWPNPHQYGRAANNYLVYPGASSTSKFQYLRHVNVRGAYIDVLVDEPDDLHPALTLGHRNVSIVTFLTDGSLAGRTKVFGNSSAAGDVVDFYGAQMVETTSGEVIVAATAYGGNGPFIVVTRLKFNNNGVLIDDNSWGFPYGGSGPNRVRSYDAPSSYCGGGVCDVIAGYVAQPKGLAQSNDVYVAASIHVSGTNWDPIVLKISSVTGSVKPEFNGSGWSRAVFDDANSSFDDRATGLYVFQDDVYMSAQVSRKCFPGIGLAKLNGATGAYSTSFGSGGKTVFGGQGNAPICFAPPGGDYPTAITGTSAGARIGIVGYRHHGITGLSDLYDPMLAVVNGVTGQVLDFNVHPVTRADDSRYGDAVLYGIFNTTAGTTSLFVVSGNGRDASAGNTLSYVAGRLVPAGSDRIFASGFDN